MNNRDKIREALKDNLSILRQTYEEARDAEDVGEDINPAWLSGVKMAIDKTKEAIKALDTSDQWTGEVVASVEPVAWMRPTDGSILSHKGKVYEGVLNYPDYCIPLYRHPPAQGKVLTDTELDILSKKILAALKEHRESYRLLMEAKCGMPCVDGYVQSPPDGDPEPCHECEQRSQHLALLRDRLGIKE